MPEHHRRLSWRGRALADLEDLADFMPAAALGAVDAMARMAAAGFNYGRATSEPGVWYLPAGKLGVFYSDQGGTLAVDRVVDARRLKDLP
jgi:hypothetical protein